MAIRHSVWDIVEKIVASADNCVWKTYYYHDVLICIIV